MRRFPLAVLALLALAPATASAAPAVSGEFPPAGLSETPGHLTLGPDGNIWVALGNKKIAKVTPDGGVTEFSPAAITGTLGSITSNPDGNLWVTQAGGGNNGVVKIPPSNPNGAVATPITGLDDARGLVTGPDNNLWAASNGTVFKISPANPATFTPYAVVTGARGIARGNDGQLWVADFGGGRIVSVTTAGAPTSYTTGGGPQEVFAGPGTQIGYTNPGATPENIGRITPGGTPQSTPMDGDPFGITFGNDGAYWIARFAANQLVRFTPDGQTSPLTGFTAGAGPRQITKGPGDTLWVSLETSKKIARITGVSAPAAGGGGGGGGGGGAFPVDKTPPVVSSVSQSHRTWHLGSALARFARSPIVGTTFSFRVNEQSTTTFTFRQMLPGRRVGSRCLAPTRARRNRRRCTRLIRVSPSLSYKTKAARHRLKFQGRLSRRKTLKPGRYQLTIQSIDAAKNKSRARTLTFTVLPAVPRRR